MRLSFSALPFAAGTLVLACGSSHVLPPDDAGPGDGGPAPCVAPKQSCGDACVDTQSDAQNCGACGNACKSADLCCTGKCVGTPSCLFAVTKIDPYRGFQNGGEWLRLEGAGFTKDMTVEIGDGRAPVLVTDSQHAVVQVPPAPVGTYDVTLKSVQGTATTRAAYQYQSANVMPPWKDVGLGIVRGEHPAVTPLQDGRVLIAGGATVPDMVGTAVASAVVFSRNGMDGAIAPTAGPMGVPRWRCAATTMLDGRAIVTGGATCTGNACKAGDLFDPKAGTFKATSGLMSEDRNFTWSVLMADGRVMVTSAPSNLSMPSSTVDVYDPATDMFAAVALATPHYFGQRIVRLRDGRVMVLGGNGCAGMTCGPAQAAVDLYDPQSGKFSAGAPMQQGRSQFTAHVLPDGRVMVFGGSSSSAGGVHVPLDSIEAYDPKTGVWTTMPYKLTTGRTWHASALVRDGTVLVMGGYNVDAMCTATNTVDVVDPVKGTVTAFAALGNANTEWNAVTMLDGSVVGVGGGECGATMALPDVYFLPGATGPN